MEKQSLTSLLQITHPVIMAPMFLVSNTKMVIEGMKSGVAGCIPALNYRTLEELKSAIHELKAAKVTGGSFGFNLIVNKSNVKYKEQLRILCEEKVDFILDAIDSLKNKALLVAECKKREIPLLVTGGAAGKIDPTKIIIQDLGESINDSLLFRLRKILRKNQLYPKGEKFSVKKKQKFNITCVYSPEDALYPTATGEVCHTPDQEISVALDCEAGMGSASHITAIFGFMSAGHIINSLVKKRF